MEKRDITARRKADEALRESKDRLNFLLSANPAVIYSAKIKGDFGATFISDNIVDPTGYAPEDFIGDPAFWINHIHPEDRKRVENEVLKGLEEGCLIHEYRFMHKNGIYRFILDAFKVVYGKDGKPEELIGYWTDITDRKKAEEALIESETRYREMFNNLGSGVAVYTALENGEDFIFKDINLTGEKLSTIRKIDIIGKKVTDVFPGVKEFGLLEIFQQVWKTGKAQHHPISLYKDEKLSSWYKNYVYKLPTGDIVAIYDDITLQKSSERALKESEERFQAIYINTPAMMHSIDSEGKLSSVSKYWLKTLGYEADEVIGRKSTEFLTEASKKYASEVVLPDFFKTGICTDIPYEFIKKNGEVIDVLLSAISEKDMAGNIIRSYAVITDITDRKKAEEELRRFEHIVSSSKDMMALMDKNFVYIAVNNAYINGFGMTRDEIIGHSVSEIFGQGFFEKIIKPHAERCLAGEEVIYYDWFEFPVYGSQYMEIIYTSYIGADGEISGFVVNGRIITEKKKADDELIARTEEVERVNRAFVGRELKMVALKKEIEELKKNK